MLVARNRVHRRTAVGYPATSGFPSKQDFSDQFQFRVPAFEFVGIVYAGNFSRPATDLVPRTTLLAQTAKLVKLLKAISRWGNGPGTAAESCSCVGRAVADLVPG